MAARAREISPGRCAYCGAPLTLNAAGVVAWRVGNRFVCNEFCADGLPDVLMGPVALPAANGPKRRAPVQAPKPASLLT
jgi:hypothetical protein